MKRNGTRELSSSRNQRGEMPKQSSPRNRPRIDVRGRLRRCPGSIFVFLLAFLSLAATAQEPAATTSLDRFLEGLDGFSSAFEQTLTNERGEQIEKSVGVVYVHRPGKFHWAYWEPYSQYIISDGVTLWIYDEDLEQVTIKDVAQSLDDTPAEVLGGYVDVNLHYVVIDLGDADGVNWLELTPRNIESQYQAVRLGFRDGGLAGMILYDNLDQKTDIVFSNTKRNPSLKPELFEFTPPDGVDVIDSREPQPGSADTGAALH